MLGSMRVFRYADSLELMYSVPHVHHISQLHLDIV